MPHGQIFDIRRYGRVNYSLRFQPLQPHISPRFQVLRTHYPPQLHLPHRQLSVYRSPFFRVQYRVKEYFHPRYRFELWQRCVTKAVSGRHPM